MSALLRVLVGTIRMLRRLPLKGERSDMTHVIMHGWWCEVEG